MDTRNREIGLAFLRFVNSGTVYIVLTSAIYALRGFLFYAAVDGIHTYWWSAVPKIELLPAIAITAMLYFAFSEFPSSKPKAQQSFVCNCDKNI